MLNMNPKICEVCWDEQPVFLPFITCAHSSSFCERCVKRCLAERRRICPKCRSSWPNVQNHRTAIPASTIIENVYFSPSSTADGLFKKVFEYFSIGLLIGFIIYPAVKHL